MTFSELIDRVAALATLLRLFVYDTQNEGKRTPKFHAAEVAGGVIVIRLDGTLAEVASEHLLTVSRRLDSHGQVVRIQSNEASRRRRHVRLELAGTYTGIPVSVVVQAESLEALRLHQALARQYGFFDQLNPAAVGISPVQLLDVLALVTADCDHGRRWTDSCPNCDAADSAVQA